MLIPLPTSQPSPLAFLSALFGDAPGWIETRYIPDTKQRGYVHREWYARIGDLVDRLPAINAEAQRQGDAVFFGVLPRKARGTGTTADIAPGSVAWCDVDFKDMPEEQARAKIAALPLAPSIVVHSGRGLHLYWLMQEATEPACLSEIGRRLAYAIGADHCFDAARILRMPGSLNLKNCWSATGYTFDADRAFPVVVESFAPDRRYQPFDFDDLPEAPAPATPTATLLPLDAPIPEGLSPKVKRLLERPRLAAYWKGEGKTSGDLSNSGYDVSLLAALVLCGCTDKDELAAAVAARPTTGKPRTPRDIWRRVDFALQRFGPAKQEVERLEGGEEEPTPEEHAEVLEEPAVGVVDAIRAIRDRVGAAGKDKAALRLLGAELVAPGFVADVAALEEDERMRELAQLYLTGFTGYVRALEKAIKDHQAEAEKAAQKRAAERAKETAKRLEERRAQKALNEDWPVTREGPHPGVQSVLFTRNGRGLACHANLRIILEVDPRWGGRFKRNLLGGHLEADGAPVDSEPALTSDIVRWVSRTYDIHFEPDAAQRAVYAIAGKYAYHPVRDYLEALPAWDGEARIGRLLGEVLKVKVTADVSLNDLALYQKFLRRFLISAVARALHPGCKVDTALIFVGEQGAKKSTFFKVLFGNGWFGDSPIPIGHKDAPLQLQAVWCYECAEMESLSKKTAEDVKQFLSSASDLFRQPYERNARHWPRHCVIVGTTNRPQFLSDASGSRRFWPILVPDDAVLDIEQVRRWRDQLWAEAVSLYREAQAAIAVHEVPSEACRWWFERDEDRVRGEHAQQFEVSDAWDDLVLAYVSSQAAWSIPTILTGAISMPKDRMDQAAKNRVGAILRRHGWTSKRVRMDGPDGRRSKLVEAWTKGATMALPPDPETPEPTPRGQGWHARLEPAY